HQVLHVATTVGTLDREVDDPRGVAALGDRRLGVRGDGQETTRQQQRYLQALTLHPAILHGKKMAGYSSAMLKGALTTRAPGITKRSTKRSTEPMRGARCSGCPISANGARWAGARATGCRSLWILCTIA